MARRLLIMGASLQKDPSTKLMPALLRYRSARWDVLREELPILLNRPRVIVLSPKYGFISLSQPIAFYTNEWHGAEWKKQLPQLQASYNATVRRLIDPGTDIFISANAPHLAVLNACGIQQDAVDRKASIQTPRMQHVVENQILRAWLHEGVLDGTQGTMREM